jgi:hypothetical protein
VPLLSGFRKNQSFLEDQLGVTSAESRGAMLSSRRGSYGTRPPCYSCPAQHSVP